MKLLIAYTLAGLITYGHAWRTIQADDLFQRTVCAAFVAAVWPLYVSVEAWK